jgi:HSP20 family protein
MLKRDGRCTMLREMIQWTSRLHTPLATLENEFEELMERLFRPEEGFFNGLEKFTPISNFAETEKAYEVTVELPGMKPEEFNVEVKNGELWITGERKEEKEEKGKTWHRVERRYGEFRRIFALPAEVKEEEVKAEYKEGVLHIIVPKAEVAKPRKIEVTV